MNCVGVSLGIVFGLGGVAIYLWNCVGGSVVGLLEPAMQLCLCGLDGRHTRDFVGCHACDLVGHQALGGCYDRCSSHSVLVFIYCSLVESYRGLRNKFPFMDCLNFPLICNGFIFALV
jgi:hypothetical protein